MTWYFRTIEPRKGRVFAEIKIKHLNAFPLPRAIGEAGGCDALNALGRQRIAASSGKAVGNASRDQEVRLRLTRDLDRQIDDCVLSMIGPEEELRRHVLTEGKGD
jgi:hypothetical protein